MTKHLRTAAKDVTNIERPNNTARQKIVYDKTSIQKELFRARCSVEMSLSCRVIETSDESILILTKSNLIV